MRGSGCIVNADVGGSTLVGPAWGVCVVDGDGGRHWGWVPMGQGEGAHVIDTSGGQGWWVVHGVVAASSTQAGSRCWWVVLGVVSESLTQAVVVDIGDGRPWGRVGAGVVDASDGRCWWVVHGVVAASLTQVGVVDVDGLCLGWCLRRRCSWTQVVDIGDGHPSSGGGLHVVNAGGWWSTVVHGIVVVGACIVDASGGRPWWVVHRVAAMSLTHAVVVDIGGGCPWGGGGLHC